MSMTSSMSEHLWTRTCGCGQTVRLMSILSPEKRCGRCIDAERERRNTNDPIPKHRDDVTVAMRNAGVPLRKEPRDVAKPHGLHPSFAGPHARLFEGLDPLTEPYGAYVSRKFGEYFVEWTGVPVEVGDVVLVSSAGVFGVVEHASGDYVAGKSIGSRAAFAVHPSLERGLRIWRKREEPRSTGTLERAMSNQMWRAFSPRDRDRIVDEAQRLGCRLTPETAWQAAYRLGLIAAPKRKPEAPAWEPAGHGHAPGAELAVMPDGLRLLASPGGGPGEPEFSWAVPACSRDDVQWDGWERGTAEKGRYKLMLLSGVGALHWAVQYDDQPLTRGQVDWGALGGAVPAARRAAVAAMRKHERHLHGGPG